MNIFVPRIAEYWQKFSKIKIIFNFKTRFPQKNNKVCRLASPIIQPEAKCLEFYYHAFGPNVNTLNVYLEQDDQLGGPRWSRSRNQGNMWQRGELKIDKLATSYQIVFEAVTGVFQGVRIEQRVFYIGWSGVILLGYSVNLLCLFILKTTLKINFTETSSHLGD